MKKLLLFPCLLLALGLSSCESSDDEIMSIELVSPKKLAVTTELATASFKWDAVTKAEGYAYALDNSTEYTTVDAATTTLKLTRLSRGSHTFRIYAVGNQGHTRPNGPSISTSTRRFRLRRRHAPEAKPQTRSSSHGKPSKAPSAMPTNSTTRRNGPKSEPTY